MSEIKTPTHKYKAGQIVSGPAGRRYRVHDTGLLLDTVTLHDCAVTFRNENERDEFVSRTGAVKSGTAVAVVRKGFKFAYWTHVTSLKSSEVYRAGQLASYLPANMELSTVAIVPVYQLIEVDSDGNPVGIGQYNGVPESEIQ